MIKLIEKKNWSDEFLLPLTGLKKSREFNQKTYLFWRENSINDYKLVLTLSSVDYDDMLKYCRTVVFPTLDRNGYLLENYDVDGKSIFILDMSEWAMDIELFMQGRYSRMSIEAKKLIDKFHLLPGGKKSIQLKAVLYPREPMTVLENLTPIEYICKYYGFDLEEVKRIGEIGSLFNLNEETLITENGSTQEPVDSGTREKNVERTSLGN